MSEGVDGTAVEALGKRLAARLHEAQLSAEEVAHRSGVPRDALDRFVRGEAPLGVSAVTRIARTLRVPPAGLFSTQAPEVAAPVDSNVLLLSSGVAHLTPRDLERISGALERARSFVSLGRLLGRTPPEFATRPAPEREPHNDGYAAARDLRRLIGRPSERFDDVSQLIEDDLDILVCRFRFETAHVRAAAIRSGDARLIAIDTRSTYLADQRRALAHELGHHVCDLGADGAVVEDDPSASYTHEKPPAEKRADAFALMFLAPESGVLNLIGPPQGLTDVAQARDLATKVREHFGVGFVAAVRHLENLKYFVREIGDALVASPGASDLSGFERHALPDGFERRLREAEAQDLLSAGRRRELLGLSIFDEGGA